jgi:hypothetical protein
VSHISSRPDSRIKSLLCDLGSMIDILRVCRDDITEMLQSGRRMNRKFIEFRRIDIIFPVHKWSIESLEGRSRCGGDHRGEGSPNQEKRLHRPTGAHRWSSVHSWQKVFFLLFEIISWKEETTERNISLLDSALFLFLIALGLVQSAFGLKASISFRGVHF